MSIAFLLPRVTVSPVGVTHLNSAAGAVPLQPNLIPLLFEGSLHSLHYGPALCFHLEPTRSFFSRYTSGDVRVWDTRTWDYVAPFLDSEYEEDEPGLQPYVSFVRINSSLAIAAYENGK